MLDTPLEPPSGDRYPVDMESRVAVLEQIARSTVASLERIERRLDSMDTGYSARFDVIDRRFDTIDRRFDMIDRRFDMQDTAYRSDFRWMLGLMLAGAGAMLGVMAHGFHWL